MTMLDEYKAEIKAAEDLILNGAQIKFTGTGYKVWHMGFVGPEEKSSRDAVRAAIDALVREKHGLQQK